MIALTYTEHDVLTMLLMGRKKYVIASKLQMTDACLRQHLTNLYRKFNISTEKGPTSTQMERLVRFVRDEKPGYYATHGLLKNKNWVRRAKHA